MIYAIDFDGTCVRHEYPLVGADCPGAVATIHWLIEQGHQIILWTMRSGLELDNAVEWFQDRDLPLWGINKNPDQDWTSSPKAYAHVYIDDMALGCPLVYPEDQRPYVDWEKIWNLLR